MAADLEFVIGASIDPNAERVLTPMIAAMNRAQRTAQAQASAAARASTQEALRAARDSRVAAEAEARAKVAAMLRADREVARSQSQAERERTRAAQQAARERQRIAEGEAKAKVTAMVRADREVERAMRAGAREAARISRDRSREVERTEREANQRAMSWVRRTERAQAQSVHDANRRSAVWDQRIGAAAGAGVRAGASTAVRVGRRVLGDMVSGMSIDTDFSSGIRQGVHLESAAVALSNSAYQPNAEGKPSEFDRAMGRDARKRVDPSQLVKEVRDVANFAAFDPTKAMAGLQAFVAKTGDLGTARDIFKDLAKYSKASGTDLEDMVDAAGDVSNALGDVDNKGEKIKQVMRMIAGQGKLGAVEIKDLSSQMAKLAAQAPQFEGDAGNNIAVMGMLAQEARQRGGAVSAQGAATAVTSFAGTFGKNARYRNMMAVGIDPYSKTEKGKLRDPREIIVEALQKTGGDPVKMGKLFADVQAQRVTKGFGNIYRDAYLNAGKGGASEEQKVAAATKAVRDEMDRLMKAEMDAAEISESFAKAMGTSESKVQLFNNKLAESGDEMRKALLPAVEQLAPRVVDLAKSFTDAVGAFTGEKQKWEAQKGFNTETNAGNVDRVVMDAVSRTVVDNARGGSAQFDPKMLEGLEQKRAELAKQVAEDENASKKAHARLDSGQKLSGTDYLNPGMIAGKMIVGAATYEADKKNADTADSALERRKSELDRISGDIAHVKELIGSKVLTVKGQVEISNLDAMSQLLAKVRTPAPPVSAPQ
jgi:hypothetical protein